MPYYEEWEEILETRSVSELIPMITGDHEQGQRLRQSTPFVGVLTAGGKETIPVGLVSPGSRGSKNPVIVITLPASVAIV